MKTTLWTKNFTLVTVATIMGAAGAIASNFALSFLVFDETGSTLAAAFIIAIQLVPNFLIPLWLSPWMDRMPRKPFLVAGDTINGVLYAFAGFYLLNFEFSY
ncbi:MAG: MFS transporter, partial [Clostridia bacterium]